MDFALRLNKILIQSSEFKSWFLVFGCFPRVLIILGLFLLFGVSLKVLQFSSHARDLMRFLCDFRGKSASIRTVFWLKTSVVEVGSSKTCQKLNSWTNRCLFGNKLGLVGKSRSAVDPCSDVDNEEKCAVLDEHVRNEEKECYSENGESDVIKLKKLVKTERNRKNRALAELEKERTAAATAAQEAMSMIFRLQSEKSAVEIHANQFRRIAEQKLQYDQEVIESLQRIILEYESERFSGEDLAHCRPIPKQRLQQRRAGEGTSLFDCDLDFGLEDDLQDEHC